MGGSILAFWVGILYAILAFLVQIYNLYTPASLNPSLPELWSWTMASLGLLLYAVVPVFVLRASRSRLRFIEPPIRQPWEMRRARRAQWGQTAAPPRGPRAARSWWEYEDGQNPILVRERLGYAASQMLFHLASWYLVILLAHGFFWSALCKRGAGWPSSR